MADRLGPSFHTTHDVELVARAAAGDLAASEATAAHRLLAACDHCAELAADLRAIAAATRRLPSASSVLAAAPAGTAGRDFRLTEADAARLRRRGFPGLSSLGDLLGSRSRGFGGAVAAFGLVGLLVAAGMPSLLGGGGASSPGGPAAQDGGATVLAPAGEDLDLKEAASEAPAPTTAAAAAPFPSDERSLAATPEPPAFDAAGGAPAETGETDAARAAGDIREADAGTPAGWFAVILALVSAVVLVVGLNLLLAGRNGRRAGP